ncbi:D-lactate dehydrogenase (cytochrome) [Madurella fahalii]|uniref:D-lactate dehydrogenase (Cytochrome) n=1 Tax=Madurella fahalii TaxID=1157608 RepID=A0ABQ0GKJ6_9PEZI
MAGRNLVASFSREWLSRGRTQLVACRRYSQHHGRPTSRSSSGTGPFRVGGDARRSTIVVAAAAAGAMGLVGFSAGMLLGRGTNTDIAWNDGAITAIEYANRTEMLHAAEEIARVLGQDAVSYDADVLEHHGHSDWSTSNSPERAVAVAYPRSTEDVSTIARICNRRNVPMVPFGAGSSVEGNFSQPHSGICVDFCYMDKIIAFHPDDMDIVVQPGVNWVDLNSQIANSGLFAPMDPSPTATVGGMVSTNCSGTNAFRYGTMKDWVLNLTVVLADGRVIKTRRRPRKTSAGYNLTSLFVGAEGTLGMITEITLKLAPIPQDTSVAVVSFPSIRDAAGAATSLIRSGIQLAALEIMDEQQMKILNVHGSAAVRRRKWAEQPTLFLKFSGTTDSIKSDIRRCSDIIQSHHSQGHKALHFARSKQEEHDLWAARKESLFTMTSIRPPGTEMWSTDVAVPVSRLAEIIEWSKTECSKLGIFASVIGHVGDGNFHVAMMYDPRDAEQAAAVSKCVHRIMGKALEMEGTVSGEHAIGIGKKDCLIDELGPETIGLMRQLKGVVDPKWIMNPGKVFDHMLPRSR